MSWDKLIKFVNEFNIAKCFKENLFSFIQICYVHFFQTLNLINLDFLKVMVFNNSTIQIHHIHFEEHAFDHEI
jgi:hypothetical protein